MGGCMILYFEDGHLSDTPQIGTLNYYSVDAGEGFTSCQKRLNYIQKECPNNAVVYSNSVYALSNYYCWNNETKRPEIYMRKNGKWTHILALTDRDIRRAHNLEKLYVNGAFNGV